MIGILTFHRAANYGAVLQAYALQQTLNELNLENEIIDYRCEYIEKHYNPKPSVSLRHPNRYLIELKEMPLKIKTRAVFDEFLRAYVKTSDPVIKRELLYISSKYRTIITGSDQVWHMAVSGDDTAYVLDFAPDEVRKVSYAASIGPKDMKDV